jgi:hypothetical protein
LSFKTSAWSFDRERERESTSKAKNLRVRFDFDFDSISIRFRFDFDSSPEAATEAATEATQEPQFFIQTKRNRNGLSFQKGAQNLSVFQEGGNCNNRLPQ